MKENTKLQVRYEEHLPQKQVSTTAGRLCEQKYCLLVQVKNVFLEGTVCIFLIQTKVIKQLVFWRKSGIKLLFLTACSGFKF